MGRHERDRRGGEPRPREKLFLHGPSALADVELVAVLLGGGLALRRAWAVLETFCGLDGLRGAYPQELLKVHGIGMAGAAALSATGELSRRIQQLERPLTDSLRRPSDVQQYARARYGDVSQELFVVIGLDARQRVQFEKVVAVGSLAQVDVHPREVYRPLIRAGVHCAIVVHNHPSGDPEPSDGDLDLTRRLEQVGALVGIPLVDHLVVTPTRWVSLASQGMLCGDLGSSVLPPRPS